MKKVLTILMIISCISAGMVSSYKEVSKQAYDTNAKMKAVFLYNFTRYIEWPESYKKGNFVIGLYGKTPVEPEINKVAETKKAVDQTIEVVHFNSLSDLSKCHMLYVSKEKSSDLAQVVQKTKGNSTLIITEQEGLAKNGAGISFTVINNRQKFQINKANIEKREMNVGSALLSLAIQVQ